MSNPFQSVERDRFFRQLQMPWYNLALVNDLSSVPSPYALYHCHPVTESQIAEMNRSAKRVGEVLLYLWSVIRKFDAETLLEYGFPEETIRVVKFDGLAPFCMRLDWCWNETTGVHKVIEANVQTPSFWFECIEGNARVAEHFGMKSPQVGMKSLLSLSISQQLQRAADWLKKPIDNCKIGLTTLDNLEDIGTMRWLNQFVSPERCTFPLEELRIKDHQSLFHEEEQIDILFMWYPVEWAINDRDSTGAKLWDALEELILKRKIAIVNFASAFSLQPKSIFALISDLGLDFFPPNLAETVYEFFPKTAQTVDEMGDTYFAKPVLGRQGEGCFSMVNGEMGVQSANQDPWYTEQDYVYQELLDFPTLEIEDRSMTALWSTWLFNDGTEFAPGGVGLRLSEGKITDDYSYWCPIGICA
ncbi:glutathionylspermidine synthase family protein [Leptolyngbya sp. AN03gr2]|uniref:glutathionylspermidine synthase family protein n=1 Tax=unclassified Leptolyngbya TaxID=2650499 RepID=UPI003D31B66B